MPTRSFADDDTSELYRTGRSKRWSGIVKVAVRKLDMLDAAGELNDLRTPSGNRLEPLKGQRSGQHSIRINDQFRLCFPWLATGPQDVEITDSHGGHR